MSFTKAEVQEAKDRFKASVNADNSTVEADQREVIVEDALTALDSVPTTDGDSQLATARKADRKPRGRKKEGDDSEPEAAADEEGEGEEDLDAMLEG